MARPRLLGELVDLFAVVGEPEGFEEAYREAAGRKWPSAERQLVRELLFKAAAAHCALRVQSQVQIESAALLDALGIIVLVTDASGTVVDTAAYPAGQSPRSTSVVVGKDRRIAARTRAATTALRAAIAAVASGEVSECPVRVTGRRSTSRECYVVCRQAGGGRVFLAFAEPEPRGPTVNAARTCRLSGRETEVLQILVEGASLPQIAARLKIATSTARAHLNSIFRKTGTASQSELLRVVLGAAL